MTPLNGQAQDLTSSFAREGYVVLPNVVSKPKLAELTAELRGEYMRARAAGELFSGGGTISGHLNCFPGAGSRFVYDELEQHGVFDFARKLSPSVKRMPNIGCNLNLPGSSAQNPHADGNVATPFLIVNVAPVDTDLENGAMETVPGTHLREYKYWQYALSGIPALRMRMTAGDVVIRLSSLWHRGMPNRSKAIRPMLAFTWEDGGSKEADPFSANGGQIRFLPNWFKLTPMGRFREKLFVKVPIAYTALRLARSIVDREY